MNENEIALLGLLSEKSRYGYEIDKIINERGMREWTDIAFSSIYAVLRGLEKKGFVVSSAEIAGNRVRKLFKITKDGKRELKEAVRGLIANPARPNDSMMLALAYASVLSADEVNLAYGTRLEQLDEAKKHLVIKLNENLKSPANVRRMFERSLSSIESEIEFAKSMTNGFQIPEQSQAATSAEPAIPETEPEPKPASKPEQKTETVIQPAAEQSHEEPKDTLF